MVGPKGFALSHLFAPSESSVLMQMSAAVARKIVICTLVRIVVFRMILGCTAQWQCILSMQEVPVSPQNQTNTNLPFFLRWRKNTVNIIKKNGYMPKCQGKRSLIEPIWVQFCRDHNPKSKHKQDENRSHDSEVQNWEDTIPVPQGPLPWWPRMAPSVPQPDLAWLKERCGSQGWGFRLGTIGPLWHKGTKVIQSQHQWMKDSLPVWFFFSPIAIKETMGVQGKAAMFSGCYRTNVQEFVVQPESLTIRLFQSFVSVGGGLGLLQGPAEFFEGVMSTVFPLLRFPGSDQATSQGLLHPSTESLTWIQGNDFDARVHH